MDGLLFQVGHSQNRSSKISTLKKFLPLVIEPGIYIPANTEGIDPKYWNIGVRIEDDILVTEGGYKLMSSGVPREISEVEKLMKR